MVTLLLTAFGGVLAALPDTNLAKRGISLVNSRNLK